MKVYQSRLKQAMDERGVKAAGLAKATGISPSTISKYLANPYKEASADTWMLIAKALDFNSEYLYGFSDIKKPFNDPPVIESYEKLPETDKKKVDDFAEFLLKDKKDEPAGGE